MVQPTEYRSGTHASEVVEAVAGLGNRRQDATGGRIWDTGTERYMNAPAIVMTAPRLQHEF